MNRIPASAQALIDRCRAAGAEISENLVDSPQGPIGHVKVKAPNEPRAFLTVFIGDSWLGTRRTVTWVESSGQLTRPQAERVVRVFERAQLAALHAEIDELTGRTAPAADESELLVMCDGPTGCGATYADAMQHTQGEHDERLRERAQMPETLARVAREAEVAAEATDRRVRNLNHRIVGALLKLALLPDEMPNVIESAWSRIDSAEAVDQETFLRGLDVELQARVERLGIDAWADEPLSERPEHDESPATGCCGHVCERLS